MDILMLPMRGRFLLDEDAGVVDRGAAHLESRDSRFDDP
jgi:hypothetical protein